MFNKNNCEDKVSTKCLYFAKNGNLRVFLVFYVTKNGGN